jgi:hypothetical protein
VVDLALGHVAADDETGNLHLSAGRPPSAPVTGATVGAVVIEGVDDSPPTLAIGAWQIRAVGANGERLLVIGPDGRTVDLSALATGG